MGAKCADAAIPPAIPQAQTTLAVRVQVFERETGDKGLVVMGGPISVQ